MTHWITLVALLVLVSTATFQVANSTRTVVLRPTQTPTAATDNVGDMDDSDDTSDDIASSDESDSDDMTGVDIYSFSGSSSASDSDDSGSSAVLTADGVNVRLGSMANTTDKIVSTYRNWVGPTVGKPSDPAGDKACYRKAYIMDTCPVGFDYKLKTCWAECPMDYPVECGLECIRQSDDCASEVYAKFVSVANAFLSLVILNYFGPFIKLARTIRVGIKCARAMFGTMRAIVNYIRAIKVSDPQTSKDKLLLALYQTSYVTIDLPVSIVMCMGKTYPWEVLDPASVVMGTLQWLLSEAIGREDAMLKSWGKFKAFLTGANFTYAVNDINDTEISSLKTGMASNSSCGYELQRLTDRTWRTVAEMTEQSPDISEDDLRVAVSRSELMLNDIPTVTNNCMPQLVAESDLSTAYKTRDTLRKTYGAIVDDLIRTGKSDNGTWLSAKQYARVAVDKGLMAIASVFYIDLTRISGMLAEYIQHICGPTQFIGEIDDGDEADTLGLKTVGKAFKGSTLSWKRVGDGAVSLTFVSSDTKDVTVNIMSGGDKFAEQDVKAGATVTWTGNVTALGGRTLYLDRWRPGLLVRAVGH